ncbi:hypothetical protein [Evansella cellulosilytica]|uniref:Uncharacterized protein n=1 Tax=Evansella cellulosilytica (strain ATCC 21833 / DSM 2522 / FERM P-1141 / JCM 9156 / N-4) TaxID=649639 RepID=E6TY47_EVAC2|nr:hypothetical protein [Evansella cellulosilytica]ADU32366.1 hypothetical protein Bcell_4139 [Evansella cellulosilytica DSM 2522]
MNFQGYSNGQGIAGLPIRFITGGADDDQHDMKLNHDSYDVYVEDHYVGKHTMLVQKEDATAITDFLKKQGFTNANLEVDGDHIVVHSQSVEESKEMEKAIKVFLQNR